MGASCKVLSAENTESLPAFEGLVPCLTSGLLPVRCFKEVKHSAAALLSAYCTESSDCSALHQPAERALLGMVLGFKLRFSPFSLFFFSSFFCLLFCF